MMRFEMDSGRYIFAYIIVYNAIFIIIYYNINRNRYKAVRNGPVPEYTANYYCNRL